MFTCFFIFTPMRLPFILTFLLFSLLFSCRKDSFITSPDALVTITADTLKYDTVFVTAGSTYRDFRILNDNDQKLRISTIKLVGGSGSPFKINVDGTSGSIFSNLELDANDSLYVFVQVNVDPSSANLPFVLRDSIQIVINGKTRYVQLEAWGQNAHFFRNRVIASNETWNNDLPYVILGSLLINNNQTLTINKGCRIFVHADAPLIVDGTLIVNGLRDTVNRVYFQGDRLDDPYDKFPGAWPGIFFRSTSKDNILTYVVLKNGYQAVAVTDPSTNSNPKLTLNQCVIDNAFDAGILSINSAINATNCLVSNCGKNLLLSKGGSYLFNHCTVATYGNRYIDHKDPVLTLSNYIIVNNVPQPAALNAIFRNCIFWGENGLVNDEVNVFKNGNTAFNVTFDACLWKVQSPPANVTTNQVINNQSPLFDSIDVVHNFFNFRLKAASPAINKGVPTGVTIDLDGNPRPVGLPDLGSFEKQ
jgi:hypothetical protein